MEVKETKDLLVSQVKTLPGVKAIGQTSAPDETYVRGQSDIDLFVLCTEIPSYEMRQALYQAQTGCYESCQMEVCNGGVWGVGDILLVDGVDVMFMYFTIDEMLSYIKELLQGVHLEKEGGFYPIGRLATIHHMYVLYEEQESFTELKRLVEVYPKELAKQYYCYHRERILDEEDLGRTRLRKEVLFYHMVLESALDHFLQALYALNQIYFPSRKRTLEAIKAFKLQPKDCSKRLLQMVQDSIDQERIEASVDELVQLVKELDDLGKQVFGE